MIRFDPQKGSGLQASYKIMILVNDGDPEVYARALNYRARTEAPDLAQTAKKRV